MEIFLQYGLTALFFGVIGYFFGKIASDSANKMEREKWQLELEQCLQQNKVSQNEISQLKANKSVTASNFVSATNSSQLNIPYDAKVVKAIFGKSYPQDDLKIVEGIGPKIEELFKTSGILTWKALGETSVDRLREILSKAGDRFQMHDPGTWSKQSKLAYEGKWQELKDWQSTLDGGREV